MTPRENFLSFFKDGSNEWIPTSMDLQRFTPFEHPDNRARGLVRQQLPVDESQFGGRDWLGVDWYFDPRSGGSMEKAPLLDDFNDWEELVQFPDVESFDWKGCARRHAEYLDTDKMISSTIFSGFFERMISLAGFENASMALIDEDQEDAVRALFDQLADHYIEYAKCMHKYFGAEHFVLHDDWGSQKAPLFSKKVHDSLILPYIKKVVDGIHADGCVYEQHSCGMIETLIPGLIETGADTWCGQDVNDKDKLIGQYGDRFKFCVEACFTRAMTDAELERLADDFAEKYSDKKVWLYIGRFATPAQKELLLRRVCGN